jgi:hypothetical protein
MRMRDVRPSVIFMVVWAKSKEGKGGEMGRRDGAKCSGVTKMAYLRALFSFQESPEHLSPG